MAGAGIGLRELIDAHYEGLYRYAYRLAGNAVDAEDLTQETFGKAVSKIRQLRELDRVKPWLFQILRNLYLHRVRDEQRKRVVPLDSVAEVVQSETSAANSPVEPNQLQVALNELDESFRTPLILFYFENFSYREIAEQMNLPIGTVMSRLARARQYLKDRLQNGAVEPGNTDDL